MRVERRDEGTEERGHHDRVRIETRLAPDGSRVIGARVETQTPLDRYRARGLIDAKQWTAGDRLREIHHDTGFETVRARDYAARTAIDKVAHATDPYKLRQDAVRAYRAAIQAVGIVLSPVVLHVCCHEGSASDWAASRRWSRPKDGMVALRLGLDALALHLGD